MSIGTGSTLISQLIDAADDPDLEPSAAIELSARGLAKVLGKARAVDVDASVASANATSAGDPAVDQRADRIIKAIKLRLEASVLLDDGEPAERAAEHLQLLYPEGLVFTRGSYAAQDAAMQRMRTLMKEPTLAASLEELVGAKYITAFKKIAKVYSTMVKAMGRVVPNTVDQRSVLGLMQVSVVQHASVVLGELRDADPKSVARTRALLAPIDNFRARQSNGSTPTPKAEATPAPAPDEVPTAELEPAELS